MNIFNIRSWADARAFAYVLLPVAATLLVSKHILPNDKAQLWVSLFTAVLGPVIAAIMARTVSLVRTAIYSLLAVVQALVVANGYATDAGFSLWMPLVVALVGLSAGGVAAANTDTTPAAA